MAGTYVLVTRDTGGIGKATVAGLAALGIRVGITGRDQGRAAAAAADIRARKECVDEIPGSVLCRLPRPAARSAEHGFRIFLPIPIPIVLGAPVPPAASPGSRRENQGHGAAPRRSSAVRAPVRR
jgi:hypothetical protein